MKIKAAAALLLVLTGLLPSVNAAPTRGNSHVGKHTPSKAKSSAAAAPSSVHVGSSSIPYDLNAESDAVKKNGPLPSGLKTKGGFALNFTSSPAASTPGPVALDASYGHTSTVVKDLEFYTTLAANAYCSDVQNDEWTCAHCTIVPDGKLILSFTTPNTDNVGYILQSDANKAIYITFRGTNSLQSFVDDLQFTFTNYPPVSGAKVHNGFYATFKEAADLVFSNAAALITAHPDYQFYVAGHSLGGALAILEALDLIQRDSRFTSSNLKVYTYGEPRVGNPVFATYATGTGLTIKRTVNQHDIVPHLPPESFGFLHEGDEFWITDSQDDVTECNTVLDSPNCSDSIVPFTTIVDHLSYFGINTGLCL